MAETFFEKLKKLHNNIYVLGSKWFQYRETFLTKTPHCSGIEKVLDAGCGDAWVKKEFERFNVELDYYGIDLAIGDQNLEYKLSAFADLHAIPFKSNSFDKIVSNSVLEHVEYPDQVFKEMARVLVPGGRMFLSVPQSFALHQRPYDFHRFTKYILEKYAERNHLKIITLWPQGGVFTVLRYVLTNYQLGSVNSSVLWKLSFGALSTVLKIVDRVIGAPITYFLDKFDKEKYLTLGYFIIYEKLGEPIDTNLSLASFRCPVCADDDILISEDLSCSICKTKFDKINGIPNLALKDSFSPRSDKFKSL